MIPLRHLLVFCFLFVISCSSENITVSDDLPFCTEHTSDDNACRFILGETSIWISSSTPQIGVEQQTRLLIWSDQPFNISGAEIRGVNMYMGRLPVEVEQIEQTTWTADFMLGACTEPRMVWELIVRITTGPDKENAAPEQQTLRIPFVTSGFAT